MNDRYSSTTERRNIDGNARHRRKCGLVSHGEVRPPTSRCGRHEHERWLRVVDVPDESSHKTRVRPNRGRPTGPTTSDRRRASAPTHTRLLALRVLERVSSAGAYADLLLHSALARSSLNAPDRAFATDLVYGTLRWRGKIDYYLSHFVDQDLAKLEPLVASTLQLGAYQLLCTDRVPASAAVDQSVRCIRAAGMGRATGLVNAVLRRLSLEHDKIMLPSIQDDPTAHLTHALSLPRWLAERWIERFGVEGAVEFAKASNQLPPLTIRANRARGDAGELLQDLLENFPDAAACRFATDGIVLGRKGNPASGSKLPRRALYGAGRGLTARGRIARPPARRTGARSLRGPGWQDDGDRRAGRPFGFRRRGRPQRAKTRPRAARRAPTRAQRDPNGRPAMRRAPSRNSRRRAASTAILVDAPCSGLGTLRRNPDAQMASPPGDPARLAEVQRAILKQRCQRC